MQNYNFANLEKSVRNLPWQLTICGLQHLLSPGLYGISNANPQNGPGIRPQKRAVQNYSLSFFRLRGERGGHAFGCFCVYSVWLREREERGWEWRRCQGWPEVEGCMFWTSLPLRLLLALRSLLKKAEAFVNCLSLSFFSFLGLFLFVFFILVSLFFLFSKKR